MMVPPPGKAQMAELRSVCLLYSPDNIFAFA